MNLGITFNLKSDFKPTANDPDDRFEELDSEETIEAIERSMRRLGHTPHRLGWGAAMLEAIAKLERGGVRLDGVFNLAEGIGGRGRESQVPATLEMLGIPFTGSDALTLALSLDKGMAKRVAASHGIPTAPFRVIERIGDLERLKLEFPLFAKPALEGSSMGISSTSFCANERELNATAARLLAGYGPVLVEEFLPGEEFTVGVIGNGGERRVIGSMQVVPRTSKERFIYSLEMKRDFRNQVDYLIPPQVSRDLVERVERHALEVVRVFNCRDVTRVDLRCDRHGEPNFIEMNPLPGINPSTSDLVIISNGYGWTYDSLIEAILGAATTRWQAARGPLAAVTS